MEQCADESLTGHCISILRNGPRSAKHKIRSRWSSASVPRLHIDGASGSVMNQLECISKNEKATAEFGASMVVRINAGRVTSVYHAAAVYLQSQADRNKGGNG